MPNKRRATTRSQQQKSGALRSFWSGTLSFGLVNLPVNLYSANRTKPVTLRMVDQEGTLLRRRYFCEKEQRVLENSELVRGYEIKKHEFVVIHDHELDELAPEKSQEIDLKRFSKQEEIDPIYFQRAYILTPDKGATKAYRLLAKSMEVSHRAGIATFVMRGKEQLVAIIAEKGILYAEVLRFPEELRPIEELHLPTGMDASKRRIRRFETAIKALSSDALAQDDLNDRHSKHLLERIHSKLDKNQDIIGGEVEQEETEQSGEVIDLMQVLKESLKRGHPPQLRDEPRRKANRKKGKKATKQRSKPSVAEKLASLSKHELYERAQQLDIPGRSNMNKSKLIEAINASS